MSDMKEDLLFFWGWSHGDTTDKDFRKCAPDNWNIHTISYQEIMPIDDPQQVSRKLIDFLDQKNIERVSVYGHSVGGAVALNFTNLNPTRVKHLYISDSEGIYEPQSPWQLVRNVIDPGPNAKVDLSDTVENIIKIIKQPLLYTKLAYFAHKVNLEREARDVKVPVTIIWGEKDKLTPLSQGQRLHFLVPNSKLVVLKDEGHDWILYRPEKFWGLIESK